MEYEKEATKLWRVYRTVKEMVRDRGYNVGKADVEISLDDFKRLFAGPDGSIVRSKMNFQALPFPETAEKFPQTGSLWVGFSDEASVGVKTMREFVLLIGSKNFSNAIFIYQTNITPSAAKIIPSATSVSIDTFQENDLVVNVTKHVLVPRHIPLSDPEKKELLTRYRLKESQLPRMQREDPVSRYFGLKRGQVVKIIRRSETSGRYASYRICL